MLAECSNRESIRFKAQCKSGKTSGFKMAYKQEVMARPKEFEPLSFQMLWCSQAGGSSDSAHIAVNDFLQSISQ